MKRFLKQEDLHHLAAVIDEVEKNTSGQMRLMIVRRSSVTGHVHTLLWALLIAFILLVLRFGYHEFIFYERWWMWPVILIGGYIITGFISRFAPVQRILTHAGDLHHQVWARAEIEFHRCGLHRTHDHTGVLLFVSLMERQAVVLADKGIAEKADPHAWDKVVQIILEGARTGRWPEKLEQAIRECGAYLTAHFPPQPDKVNELPNRVILKN